MIDLRAVVSGNTVELTWAAPARSGSGRIARYEYRHAAGSTVPSGTGWRSAAARRFPGAYVDGLENGRRHAFEVRAVNVWERKGAAVRLTATPRAEAAQTLPTAPRGLRAAGSLYSGMALGLVTLNWEAPSNLGNSHLVRYEYRYAARGESLSSAAWNHGPASERTTIVRNLAVGTSYTFQLRAVTRGGRGGLCGRRGLHAALHAVEPERVHARRGGGGGEPHHRRAPLGDTGFRQGLAGGGGHS